VVSYETLLVEEDRNDDLEVRFVVERKNSDPVLRESMKKEQWF